MAGPTGQKSTTNRTRSCPPISRSIDQSRSVEDPARSARRTTHGGTSPVTDTTPEQAAKPEEHRTEEGTGPEGTRIQKPQRQPKPKPERSEAQREAHTAVTAAYCTAFEQARGVKPPFGARDGAAVYELLAAVSWDVQRATAAIRNGLSAGAWPADATIRTIASDPARYATPPKPTTVARPVQRAHDGSYLDRLFADRTQICPK